MALIKIDGRVKRMVELKGDNMKKDMLKTLMEETLEKSKQLLLRDGYVTPVAFMSCENTVGIIPLRFKNHEEKMMQMQALGEMAKVKRADAVFVVVESWYVTHDKVDLSIVPSKHPNRKECIFIIGECEEGYVTLVQTFERREMKGKGKGKKKEEFIFGGQDCLSDTGFSVFKFGIKKTNERSEHDGFVGYA